MPHVAFVPLAGLRVREEALLELGMSLPGLRRRAAALAELPSLGLLTLAGMTPEHWRCSYRPLSGGDASDAERLIDELVEESVDLVAVSALTASIDDAYSFCDRARRRGLRVVIGGLHATTLPEEARLHCDAVVVGEGEPVWPRILDDAERGTLLPVYRASAPFDLRRSPVPRFDLLGIERPPRMMLQTERGCPFACDFCGASRLLGPFREKPVSNVVEELEAMTRLSASPWLELADDNTFADRRDAEDLLAALADSRVRYFTEVDWRIGERPELLRDLASSGCVQVLVGIESLAFRYPGMGAKAADLARMTDAVRAIQDAGVVVNGCFIVGADGETEQSLDRLISFVLESDLAEVQITLQTPFPGTGLYRRLRDQNRLLPERGWSYYTLFDLTYRPDKLDVEQLEKGFRRVLREVFSAEGSARRARLRREIWRNNGGLRSCRTN